MMGVLFVSGVVIACVSALMWRRYSNNRTRPNFVLAAGMSAIAFVLIGVPAFFMPLA